MQNKNAILKQALINIHLKEVERIDKITEAYPPDSKKMLESRESFLEKIHDVFSGGYTDKKRFIKFLIAATLIIALIATVCACGKTIVDFIIERFELGTRFDSNENGKVITDKYIPTYIPEEYTLIEDNFYIVSTNLVWSNGNDKIIFTQGYGVITLNTEHENYFTNTINGNTVYYIEISEHKNAIWKQDGFTFDLVVPSTLTWDEIDNMILSVKMRECN